MSRPGVEVTRRETPPPREAALDTGQWLVVGVTEKGPVSPTEITSPDHFERIFGARLSYSTLSDVVETYFANGGAKLIVSRVTGADPDLATRELEGDPATADHALLVSAASYGTWGNDLLVEIEAGVVSGFVIVISDADGELDRSGDLLTRAAAVEWGEGSDYVDISLGVNTDTPGVAAAAALTGGDDDYAAIVTADYGTALDRFERSLGPGQVSAPGVTTEAVHTLLLDHADDNNRIAILDAPASSSVGTLRTAALAFDDYVNNRRGALFAPQTYIRGLVPRTQRTVPRSPIVCGHIARVDSVLGPNVPAAGDEGQDTTSLGLAALFTDAERELLNDTAVNVAILKYGGVRTYGWRTLAPKDTDPNWWMLSNARLIMAIEAIADSVGEHHLFRQIDGRGLELAQFKGDLEAAACLPFYRAGSLYGATPEEAFFVDVGPTTNTDETLADGQLKAVISVRVSPFAEWVRIEIVKRAITEPLVA